MRRGVDPKGPLPSANAERQGGGKMMMVVDDDDGENDCDDGDDDENVTEALVCILKAGR